MGYTHGFRWTDDEVKKQILRVKESLNLNRMPTRKEIDMIEGNCSLTNKISKTKGFYGWAEELKLNIKDSETTLGKKYEYIIQKFLIDKGYKVEKMSQNYHFDLLINGNVKVDVKVAKIYINPNGNRFHTFNLYKKYASCDIYIAICLDENENISKMLIIPNSQCQIKQLSIGEKSIYDKYNYKTEYIDKYIKFYNELL